MKKGISLVALIATIVIVFVLITTVTVSGINTVNNSKKTAFGMEINMIQNAVDSYYTRNDNNYPKKNAIQLDISDVSTEAKKQFEGEQILNSKISLYEIDLVEIDINTLKYGTHAEGENDIYVVSAVTGKVYYAKGLQIGYNTFFTNTKEIENLLSYNDSKSKNSSSAIIFTPSDTNWTNKDVSVEIKVPSIYKLNSIKIAGSSVSIPAISDGYYKYTATQSGNYDIVINYTEGSNSKEATYIVDNVDKVAPVFTVDTANQKKLENKLDTDIVGYMKIKTKTEDSSGIKIFKFDEGKVGSNILKEHFSTQGKDITEDIIPVKEDVRYVTVYMEDNAGNYGYLYVTVNLR